MNEMIVSKQKNEASCQCGKVKYLLSRDAPLDSKLGRYTTFRRNMVSLYRMSTMVTAVFMIVRR